MSSALSKLNCTLKPCGQSLYLCMHKPTRLQLQKQGIAINMFNQPKHAEHYLKQPGAIRSLLCDVT